MTAKNTLIVCSNYKTNLLLFIAKILPFSNLKEYPLFTGFFFWYNLYPCWFMTSTIAGRGYFSVDYLGIDFPFFPPKGLMVCFKKEKIFAILQL